MKKKSITTQKFYQLFDDEKDITGFLDMNTAKRKELDSKANVFSNFRCRESDFPKSDKTR